MLRRQPRVGRVVQEAKHQSEHGEDRQLALRTELWVVDLGDGEQAQQNGQSARDMPPRGLGGDAPGQWDSSGLGQMPISV